MTSGISQVAATSARDWASVTELCGRMLLEIDDLAPTITAQIRTEEPEYAAVPVAEHIEHVRNLQVGMLRAIGEHRGFGPEDRRPAESLGRRRAGQGVPVQVVIGAYHIGSRELWNRMRADPGEAASRLADVAALMWEWVQLATAALAEAHSEVVRAQQADQITLRHRLIALLQSTVASDESDQIALALGFSPDGDFIVISSPVRACDSDALSALRAALDSLPGPTVCTQDGGSVVIVSQRNCAATLAAKIHQVRPGSTLALGLQRQSMSGAAQSLRDSQRLLPIASGRQTIRFEDDWLPATLLASADELTALVARKLNVIRANPHLAQAVRAYADHDLSASAAARALDVHPNTEMYRLARWHELTGWNPKVFRGLSLSLLACWLAEC